jgi:hypothetical protein
MLRSLAFGLVLIGLAPAARAQDSAQAPNSLTSTEKHAGWRLLFNGTTTDGWRGFKRNGMPSGWRVVDGALTRVDSAAGDIITLEQFQNFELKLQWNIVPGGNSGIMYRVTEAGDATYETGPEMQVLDDAGHPDGKSRLTAAGSCFGLYPSPAGIVRLPGQWNEVRIVVNGNHVEHWLNGTKVVEYELGSPDWAAKVAASKFRQWPGYGKASRGYIALQDHGEQVAFRSIKIREIR